MSQTFADFKTAIRDLLTVDGARYGVSLGSAKFFDRLVTACLLDLQSYIPQLKEGHREQLKPADVIEEGEASLGEMPEGMVSDAYYVTNTCHCIRRPFVPYPWEHRFDLFCGKPRIVGWQYFFATDPVAGNFVIYPKLTDGKELWLYWDGDKGEFEDADVVKFGAAEAQAVSYYVKAHIAREVDKDLVLSGSYWKSYAGDGNMMGIRTRLKLDWKRRAEGPRSSTSPQPEKMGTCDCTTTVCCFSHDGTTCGFSGGYFFLKGPDDLWHRITITGAVGEEAFAIGEGVGEPTWDQCVNGGNTGYLFAGGYMHLLNETTGEFVALLIGGDPTGFLFLPRKGEVGTISTTAYGYRFDPCPKIRNQDTGEYCPISLFDV